MNNNYNKIWGLQSSKCVGGGAEEGWWVTLGHHREDSGRQHPGLVHQGGDFWSRWLGSLIPPLWWSWEHRCWRVRSPRWVGQLSKRKCRVETVEWLLSQGRKNSQREKLDSHPSVLTPSLVFFPWHWVSSAGSAAGRATWLRTSSVTCGVRWHLDYFFQLNQVAKEKSSSLLNPGSECTIWTSSEEFGLE